MLKYTQSFQFERVGETLPQNGGAHREGDRETQNPWVIQGHNLK